MVWRWVLTLWESHRATKGHSAAPLTCCVTSGQSLAPSGPYSPMLSVSEPFVVLAVWALGQNVTEHIWCQDVFSLEEAAFEPGLKSLGIQ